MKSEMQPCRETLQMLDVPASFDPAAWLREQAGGTECYLLAHADDGVIWGKVENSLLTTARDAAQGTEHEKILNAICPLLREATLQTARLFNENGEVFLWRDADTGTWRARMIYAANGDQQATFVEAIDERQLLWGNQAEAISDTFTLLNDSGQGLQHIAPLPRTRLQFDEHEKLKGHIRLRVRHLISEDEIGFARITASRLVTLEDNHE